MSEPPNVYANICSTLQTDYVALLGQRDADLPALVSSIVNSNAPVPGMKFVSVALPQGMHDGDEFRALFLERLRQSARFVPPDVTLYNELKQVLVLHQTRTVEFQLRMALETLGRRTSAAYLVIVLQALPEVPQEPLKSLLLMLRDYHSQRNVPGTAGAKMRFLATGNEALWRLCYHKVPGLSPFNIAERIWFGGLSYQEVSGLYKKAPGLDKTVRLKCLTDGILSLLRLAKKQDKLIRDLSPFFCELQDYWNYMSIDSQEILKRVARGEEGFPSCLLDFRCPQIPDLKPAWCEAFWGGFLRVRHRKLVWRSPIHRAFVMHCAEMKQADSPTTLLKQELPDRSVHLKNALKMIRNYEDSEECIEEALIVAVLAHAVGLAELLNMVRQQEPYAVLERLRALAAETNSPSLQTLSERCTKQKHAMNRLLVEASLHAGQQHLPHAPQDTLPLGKYREPLSGEQAASLSPTAARHLSRSGDFHVFLAHNSFYKGQIESLARELRRRGLNPWLDKEQIPPGRWFQEIIQRGISESKSAAIFIGKRGLGRWQAIELQSFVARCVEEKIPVIPVLLPGRKDIPKELSFLKQLNYVRFVRNIAEVAALNQLEWGIRGSR